jgi:hypothetical protein
MKKILFSIVLAASLFVIGCTLAPGGAYSDKYLYTADLTISSSYKVLDTFLKFETDNRDVLLAKNPKVKVVADDIRTHAQAWFDAAEALRDSYAANPSAINKANLQSAIAVIQDACTAAAAYMAAPPPILSPAPAASNS